MIINFRKWCSMALITDKLTRKRLNDRLNEFRNFGMTLYYLLEQDHLDLKSISEMFFSDDEDKAVLMYLNLIKKIKPEIEEEAYLKYSNVVVNSNNMNTKDYKKYLNNLYTSKVIKKISLDNNLCIDKTYLNTYKYLINKELYNEG